MRDGLGAILRQAGGRQDGSGAPAGDVAWSGRSKERLAVIEDREAIDRALMIKAAKVSSCERATALKRLRYRREAGARPEGGAANLAAEIQEMRLKYQDVHRGRIGEDEDRPAARAAAAGQCQGLRKRPRTRAGPRRGEGGGSRLPDRSPPRRKAKVDQTVTTSRGGCGGIPPTLGRRTTPADRAAEGGTRSGEEGVKPLRE